VPCPAHAEFNVHTSTPVLSRKHVDRRNQTKYDIQDAGSPDELLGENSREPDVSVAQDDGDNETKDEEDNGIG